MKTTQKQQNRNKKTYSKTNKTNLQDTPKNNDGKDSEQ